MTDDADGSSDAVPMDSSRAYDDVDPDIGAAMARQLGDLLDDWLDQFTGIAEQGLDPTPLLKALAGVMRSAADELDPPRAASSAGGHQPG